MAEPEQTIAWQGKVNSLLAEGFGAEDIAKILDDDTQTADVWMHIDYLRETGLLKSVIGLAHG